MMLGIFFLNLQITYTRGHARFARSPLVVCLGDSRRHSNNPFVYTSLLLGHPHQIVLFKMITLHTKIRFNVNMN